MAVAVILAAAFAPQVAQAQEPPPPHDLALRYRHGLSARADGFISWIFVLTNQGGQHAHSGQVKVTFTPYRGGTVVPSVAENPDSTGLDPKFGHFDPATGIWHFRNLRPGETAELKLGIDWDGRVAGQTTAGSGKNRDGIPIGRGPGGPGGALVKGRGEIISSLPREEARFRYNNVTREAWRHVTGTGGLAAEGDAEVDMLLSGDLSPQVNDTVDFTVKFRHWSVHSTSLHGNFDMHEVRVKVSPSPGLELVEADPPSGTFGKPNPSNFQHLTPPHNIPISTSFYLSTGIWDLGSLPEVSGHRLYIEMPVKVRYNGKVPLEEACLTAELVNVVPPERPAFDLSPYNPNAHLNNKVRGCLGEAPTVLVSESSLAAQPLEGFKLIEFFPCVGVTAYPCNEQDSLELVADIPAEKAGIDQDDNSRITNFGRGTIFQTDSIVVQVGDTGLARKKTAAGKPFWSTAEIFGLVDSQALLPDDTWSDAREDLTVTGPSGGQLPGSFTMNFVNISDIEITDTTRVVGTAFSTGFDIEFDLDFGNLGTYVLTLDIRATHNNDTTNVTTDDVTYTDTGRYTFHVGPVAELGVRDAGASPEVGTGQKAYTIAAINNGPDAAPAVRVTLEGVPKGAEAIASEGIYTEGVCQSGLCRGVWTIGELHTPDNRRASGLTETPTLSLITTLATPADITAAITNIQDYAVCIGSDGSDIAASSETACTGNTGASWHTAAYYDYLDGNDTATITARVGTGEGHPNAVVGVRATERHAVKILIWQAVEAVNGDVVSHYEVQRSASPWTTVADDVVGTMYMDVVSETVNPAYRVRAVSIFGVPGPWSEPSSRSLEAVGQPLNLTATADGRGRIDLRWDQPGFGADQVTGYRVDYTLATQESWQTLDHGYRTSPRRYEHVSLEPGKEYCYRVAATHASGTGPFAARVCATTEGAPKDLPGEPENLRVTRMGNNFVTLAWDKPSVGGDVEYYEWQSNVRGPQEVTPKTATSATVLGLAPASIYEFQVRAVNGFGPGEWSRGIQVTLNPVGDVMTATPQELEVEKGDSGSFNVRLKRSPNWPVMVYFHSIGPECLTEGFAYQQHRILLPTNPMYPSKEFWDDAWWGPPEDRWALPYNKGLDLRIDASSCQGGETTVVEPHISSLPFGDLEGLPMWEELGLSEEEWREKWGVSRLDGTTGASVKVTVVDDGTGTQ